jgi:hypothetical protein
MRILKNDDQPTNTCYTDRFLFENQQCGLDEMLGTMPQRCIGYLH